MEFIAKSGLFIGSLILSISPFTAQAQSSDLITKLKDAGFKCEPVWKKNTDPVSGHICEISRVSTKDFSYNQPIALMIPKGVSTPSQLVLHLHGNRDVCGQQGASPRDLIQRSGLMNQVYSPAANNSITILPTSQGKGETYKSQLVPKFDQFVKWIEETTGAKSDAEWVITGQGGAHEPIGDILQQQATSNPSYLKRVKGIGLLSPTYSKEPTQYVNKLKKAVDTNSDLKIHTVYYTKSSNKGGSSALEKAFGSKHVRLHETNSPNTCEIPKNHLSKVLSNISEGWAEKSESGSESTSNNKIAN